MTDPNKYAFRMILLLLVVGIIAWFLFDPLKNAFEGNKPLNTVILGTFCIGILFSFRQTFRLKREANWLKFIKRTDTLLPANIVANSVANIVVAVKPANVMERLFFE